MELLDQRDGLMMKNGVKGSFTVEAAWLMVLILIVMYWGMFAGFMYHDKTVLEAAAMTGAQRGLRWLCEEEDIETGDTDWQTFSGKGILWRLGGFTVDAGKITDQMKRLTLGKLICASEPEFTAALNWREATVTYRAEAAGGLFGLEKALPVLTGISGSVRVSNIESEEWIRMGEAIIFDEEKE